MPQNATGCTQQIRSPQAVSIFPRRDTRCLSRQIVQRFRAHRTHSHRSQAPCAHSAAPLIQPSQQTPAHFPHRMIQNPRGFLLPRFVNVGRHLVAATVVPRPTSKNLQDCRLSLRSAPSLICGQIVHSSFFSQRLLLLIVIQYLAAWIFPSAQKKFFHWLEMLKPYIHVRRFFKIFSCSNATFVRPRDRCMTR